MTVKLLRASGKCETNSRNLLSLASASWKEAGKELGEVMSYVFPNFTPKLQIHRLRSYARKKKKRMVQRIQSENQGALNTFLKC